MRRWKPKIAIVGAGISGFRIGLELSGCYDVIVFDPKEYFEFLPCIPHSLVHSSLASWSMLSRSNYGIKIIQKRVKLVNCKSKILCLEDGQQFTFDFCVLCHGVTYPFPFHSLRNSTDNATTRKHSLNEYNKQLLIANSIVILGGGSVGVETCADILGRWGKKKKVHLVCRTSKLLPCLPNKASISAETWLRKQGALIYLSTEAKLLEDKGISTVVLSNDVAIKADLIIPCIGGQSCPIPLDEDICSTDTDGRYLVLDTLQLIACPFIFSCGDACKMTQQEVGTAFVADMQAKVIAANIRLLVSDNQRNIALKTYPRSIAYGIRRLPTFQIVSLYCYSGVLCFGELVFTGCFVGILKTAIERFYAFCLMHPTVFPIFAFLENTVLLASWLYFIIANRCCQSVK